MKKFTQKILAAMIALAMVIANFAGTGAAVVKAAVEPGVFQVKVTIENAQAGESLEGIPLQLYHPNAGTIDFSTDASGIATHTFDEQDWGFVSDPFYELRLKPDSGYISEGSIWIECDQDGDIYTYAAPDSEDFTKYTAPIELTIKREGEAPVPTLDNKILKIKAQDDQSQPVQNCKLNLTDVSGESILYTASTDSEGVWTLDLTQNKIDAIDCRLRAADDSGYKHNMAMSVQFDSTGTGEEKVVFVTKVAGKDYLSAYSDTSLPVFEVKLNTDPVVTGAAVTLRSVSETVDVPVTVTVTGKYLADKLYVKRYYVKDDIDVILDTDALEVTTAGEGDTEKTITVTLPASKDSSLIYSSGLEWKIGVCAEANGSFQRTGAIRIRRDEPPEETLIEVKKRIEEIKNYEESDYTWGSWNTYENAVEEAQNLLEGVEDGYSTNTQLLKVIKEMDAGKAGLVPDVKEKTKKELDALIAEKEELVETEYSADSWKQYEKAVNDGKAVAADTMSLKKAYQDAIEAVNTAKNNLVSIKALSEAVAGAAKFRKTDYTLATWNVYNRAVTAGKTLLKKENVTNEECADAVNAINKAQKALKKVVKVKKVAVTTSSSCKVIAGTKVQMKANVTPSNAANKAVKWTTSNSKYATVSASGKVTVKKAGAGKTVTVTATAKDGSNKKASKRITIMKHAVKKITLKANKSKTVKAGKKLAVKATVKTSGKNANKTLQWATSNKKYATVSSKGVVTAKKAGKGKRVTITAKSTDGSNRKAVIKIKIK